MFGATGDAVGGSIPACAGEPITHARPGASTKVYPRVCGGTQHVVDLLDAGQGLSPRVRGNQGSMIPLTGREGSIPACAGEPQPARTATCPSGVYPRVCGGTSSRLVRISPASGLSPRVRGNPDAAAPPASNPGSIPACAGEPLGWGKLAAVDGVYPRVCGGTSTPAGGVCDQRGLSPRVRGNLGAGQDVLRPAGSIPACAGEPPCRWR